MYTDDEDAIRQRYRLMYTRQRCHELLAKVFGCYTLFDDLGPWDNYSIFVEIVGRLAAAVLNRKNYLETQHPARCPKPHFCRARDVQEAFRRCFKDTPFADALQTHSDATHLGCAAELRTHQLAMRKEPMTIDDVPIFCVLSLNNFHFMNALTCKK